MGSRASADASFDASIGGSVGASQPTGRHRTSPQVNATIGPAGVGDSYRSDPHTPITPSSPVGRGGVGGGRSGVGRDPAWVIQGLTSRDRAIVDTVARLRMVSSEHLERLHFAALAPGGRASTRRRVLARLVTWGVLAAFERWIGGARTGSTRLIYHLGPIGWHLTHSDQDHKRVIPPSPTRLLHTLAVSGLYVALVEQSRTGGFTVERYDTEPACWRRIDKRTWLKPDAYLTLRADGYRDTWFIEVDLSTEHVPVIARKLDAYQAFHQQYPDIRMPPVLITVPDRARQHAISALIDAREDGLAHVITHDHAAGYLALLLRE